MFCTTLAVIFSTAIFASTTAQQGHHNGDHNGKNGKNGEIPEQLADGRLITSPSDFVSGLSQLKLVAGFVSNASISAPADGFKHVQCSSSYGTWVLQIQAEAQRALSKATVDRGRARNDLEAVKMALYGLLGVREAEKRMPDKERRRSVARYQQEITENLGKAVASVNEAQNGLKTPKLIIEEMATALPNEDLNDEDYCGGKNGHGQQQPQPQPMQARHRRKAIALLKDAVEQWNEVIDLHKYINQRVSRDLDQGEKPLLQYRIDAFLKDERQTVQEFQMVIAPIVQRIVKVMTIVKAIDDSYASQDIVQRFANMPIISGRRNDTEICREYNLMSELATTYSQKARDTLMTGLTR